MSFVLPLRPSRSSNAPNTPKAPRTTKTHLPPPESPRRRPSLATRAGVTKRRSSVSTTFNAPSMSFFEAMFGDDFPDTFARDNGRSCKSQKTLLDLPAEILQIVCQTLSNMDIKRLRLTHRVLAELVELRIDRVFISPNRANLDCLNSILNHHRYCLRVQEIIWDDAQLDDYPTLDLFRGRLDSDEKRSTIALEDHLSTLFLGKDEHEANYESISAESCINDGVLTDVGKAILLSSNDTKSIEFIASHAASMSIEDSYALYQKLYQDEKEIINRAWDVAGLQRALTQLPNLRRVTITSEAWRPWRSLPVYDTPFYRALPAGFRKPSVWPWIACGYPGSQDPLKYDISAQRLPSKWRGYSVVMALLVANPVPDLEEFVLDTGQEMIGLPHELFALPNIDYNNTIQVFKAAPLRRFHFSFIEHAAVNHGQDVSGQVSIDTDLLTNVISVMPHLEHLDLKWKTLPQHAYDPFPYGFLQQSCPRLKHLALRYARVVDSWLHNLIINQKTLETVVLDKVELISQTHSASICEQVFSCLRDHYAKTSLEGPRFTWIEHLPPDLTHQVSHTCKQWSVVDEELDAFLYDDGASPWSMGNLPGQLEDSFGWVMDGRDPSFRERRSEVLSNTALTRRNPWPIDGSISSVHPDWRIY